MDTNRLPPLNSLKAFEAAARYESFLEAAAEQGVTSGSISRHVRLLESWLAAELFVRRSNGVALTSAGKAYAEDVRGIFRDLRTATDRVRPPSGDPVIVISTLPIFAERWLHRRIPSFRKAFDRAELRIEAHNGEHDADREDVDAWILYSEGRHPGYSVTRLFGEEVFPVCSPQFRETLSAHPTADEVIGQPLLHDIYWTPTGRTGRAPSAPLPASSPPTCALRSTRASSRRRSTAWGWPSAMARWWPRSWRPESSFPCSIFRLVPRSPITWS